MAISHRLHSPMDIRPDTDVNETPKRIVFLSVEGNTEKDYFSYVQKYRNKLGIETLVHIETLSKLTSDGESDPEQVFDLLNDYLQIRREGILPQDIYSMLNGYSGNFSVDLISKYLNGDLPVKETKILKNAIKMAGVDIDYQKYLSEYKGEDGNDVFAVVIDRDSGSHSEKLLRDLFLQCKEKNCFCYLTNPCFEFWLLLHVSDVWEEYKDRLDEMLINKKISNRHTFVSFELSKRTRHTKHIPENKFVNYYLPNIDLAISRLKEVKKSEDYLINCIGSNLPELFTLLREKI